MSLRGFARWLSLGSVVALVGAGSPACTSEGPASAAAKDSVTRVDQSPVRRQSIGNCWIYAATSWLEALHKGASGETVDTSESWLTYWHWFDQLADEAFVATEIETGGSYPEVAQLIDRYGLMREGDFFPAEAESEMSDRQKTALAAVNASIKSGALADPAIRRDRVALRRELDRVWGLTEAQSRSLDDVFGSGVVRTFPQFATARARAAANKIILPSEFAARLTDPNGDIYDGSLSDALGEDQGLWYPRVGQFAFQIVAYPKTAPARRNFWKRVQRALHDEVPVITSWTIDFNAMTRDSRVSKEELDRRGPGPQGGHMTVMHDYQADVPGLGLLEAGKQATAEEMEKALADDTKIQFVRVKNSWGGLRPDRWDTAALPGYHDLEMTYLNGPIKQCELDAKGETDTKNCPGNVVPLEDVVLPAGY